MKMKDDGTPLVAMLDIQRSGYGLGWEYARRGRPIKDNPVLTGTLRCREFREGWRDFHWRERHGHSKVRPSGK